MDGWHPAVAMTWKEPSHSPARENLSTRENQIMDGMLKEF